MADPLTGGGSPDPAATVGQSRKEKRRVLKKLKRKQIRKETAIREREDEEALVNDPEVQLQLLLVEKEAAENAERVRREFEERERIWLEASKAREEADERRRKLLFEEEEQKKNECADDFKDNEEYEYVEGPAEIIWQGNEIIVKKKRTKIAKKSAKQIQDVEDDDRPTSNPLPPQSAAFASYVQGQTVTPKELLESVAQQVPNFGTEQDKAHCPFHLKTGACRFGSRCSRVHFYPDTSCTLLVKNMYNGPGLACEQDEGLEYTDEEIEHCYEEFYEDVHTEFLKFGELVNFKVCKNSSYHLRGNVYVHYKHLDSAILAYNTMNARYYAGKQIICEFVGVTRWKVAICGEYMKSRLKTCSHGSACNFIHCFRNPGGDYEWADWDNPPPRNWIKKMAVLFGPSVESDYQKELESEDYEKNSDKTRITKHRSCRHLSRSSRYEEVDDISNSSTETESNPKKPKPKPRRRTTRQNSTTTRHSSSASQNNHHEDNHRSEEIVHRSPIDEDGEDSKLEENGSLAKRRRRRSVDAPADHRRRAERRESKNRSYDSRERRRSEQNHYRSRCHNIKSHSNHHHKSYSSEELDSEVDSGEESRGRRQHEKHSSRHRRRRHALEHKHKAAEARKGKESSSYEKLSSDESPGRWRISEGDSPVDGIY